MCGGCAVARAPAGPGLSFLQPGGFERLSEVRAVSPPAWSPDGGSLAFSTADAVWTVRPPSVPPDEHRLAPLAGVTHVAWSPDGLMVVAVAGGRLLGISISGEPSPREAVPIEGVRFLAWAPARFARANRAQRTVTAAVAASTPASGTIIWTAAIATDISTDTGPEADKHRPQRLASISGAFEASSLAWLPGEAGIVLGAEDRNRDSARLVFIRSGAHAVPRAWTLPAGDHAALPSPEGRMIAYLEDARDGGTRVGAMRADGSGRRVLTAAGRYSGLAWSPSGTLLAFARQAGDRIALEISDVLTGEHLDVGDYRPEGAPADAPVAIAWAPDGMRLAFGTDTGAAAGFIWLATLERR